MRAVRSCHITHLHSNKCVCVCVLNMFSYLILRIWCGYFCANSISYINAIYRTCNIIVQLFFFFILSSSLCKLSILSRAISLYGMMCVRIRNMICVSANSSSTMWARKNSVAVSSLKDDTVRDTKPKKKKTNSKS